MEKALLYKEWKKTRFLFIAILAIGILLMTYMFLRIGRSFRFAGMEHLWDVIVNRKQFLFRELKYYPLAAGMLVAIFQYVPEMIQKRIKLTLHLPMKENHIIRLMLAYGLGVLLLAYIVQILALYLFSAYYFPSEFVISIFKTVTPWYLSGLVAYMLVATICLEPAWKHRLAYTIICLSTLHLFYLSDLPAAMVPMLWFLVAAAIITFPMSLLSVYRFKNGKAD